MPNNPVAPDRSGATEENSTIPASGERERWTAQHIIDQE